MQPIFTFRTAIAAACVSINSLRSGTGMLKLEAGKRYWRRDCGVSGPLREAENGWFTDGVLYWRFDGRYQSHQETKYDLIAEYTDPQPLEWKRGIPTEEECRECWIVDGASGNVPSSNGCVFKPREIIVPQAGFNENDWYLPLRIKPVEPPKPKTKMVTQRKYITLHSGEVLWTHLEVPSAKWLTTTETQIAEVPA